MSEITVANIGPVQALRIPIPESGGLVCLVGRSGVGKSRTLDAVNSLVTGAGSLEPRDGQRRGEVEGFGARITVARSTRHTGELECVALDGDFDLADLVSPPLKDPAAADARRIKALVRLSGAKADVAAYHGLAGGPEAFLAIAKPETIQADDPIDLAARVKRDFEAAARREEDRAEKQAGQATGFRQAAEGVDLEAEADAAKLQQALEGAIGAEAEIRQRVRDALTATSRATEAQEKLQAQRATYTGPTVEEAETATNAASHAYAQAMKAENAANAEAARLVVEARAALAAAESSQRKMCDEWQAKTSTASAALDAARARLDQATAYADLEASAKAAIDAAANVQAPDAKDVQAATDAVSRARRALQQGEVIRRARQQIEAAEEAEDLARTARAKALRLRDAARSTDDVLSQAVACRVLRVEAGRLVCDTDRGVEPYAELSDGERARVAIDIAIDRLDALEAAGRDVSRLLVIPQRLFQDLSPSVRQEIHGHLVERRVVGLTAQVTDGELEVVNFGKAGG